MKYYWILYTRIGERQYTEGVLDEHPFMYQARTGMGILTIHNWKRITVEEYNLWQELHNDGYGIYVAGVDPYPHSEHTMD